VPYKLMAVAAMLARDGCEGSAAQALPPARGSARNLTTTLAAP